MSDNPRDTQFRGFAKLVVHDLRMKPELGGNLLWHYTSFLEQMETLIAQRAYDLVEHTIHTLESYHLDTLYYGINPSKIPDLTQMPDLPDSE